MSKNTPLRSVSSPASSRSFPGLLCRPPEPKGSGGRPDPSCACARQVFLKETERQALQETLHREVVRKILLLQSWFRMVLERRHFLQMRRAAATIQVLCGLMGWGIGVAHTWPLNAFSALLSGLLEILPC